MTTHHFELRPDENILYHATPNRKWYIIAWKIFSGIVVIGFLLTVVYAFAVEPTQKAFISFMPAWAAGLLTKILYLGLLPLAGGAWFAEDIACTLLGEYVLTNQRIWIRSSPYAWSQSSIPLDNISSLFWRRDAIFIKQKFTKKIQVHMISDGNLFVKTYEQYIGKSKLP